MNKDQAKELMIMLAKTGGKYTVAQKNAIDSLAQIGNGDMICDCWEIEDVLSLDETLDHDTARQVLALLKSEADATIGINWDTIQYWIGEVNA